MNPESLLLALSGHSQIIVQCLLSGVKRTSGRISGNVHAVFGLGPIFKICRCALRARRLDAVLVEKSRIAPALPLFPFSRLSLSSRD
jgi:hypothetical protein